MRSAVKKELFPAQKNLNKRFLAAIYEILGQQNVKYRTISDICKKTGIKNQTVSWCKKDERCFSMEDILKLHKYFNYSPNWILLGKGARKL